MNFSSEEIYYGFGQYDSFVIVEFNYNSQSYINFGRSIMGTFIYSLEERIELEDVIKTRTKQRTDKKIKFNPIDLDNNLNDEQRVMLDKEGFLCSDIVAIKSSIRDRYNRFSIPNHKNIPNTINIPFDSTGFSINRAVIHLGNSRMEKGPKLCPDELNEYYGTILFYLEKQGDKVPESFLDENGKVKKEILLYKYNAQVFEGGLAGHDKEEYIYLKIQRGIDRMNLIEKELKRAGTTLNKVTKNDQNYIHLLTDLCLSFEGETLLLSDPPVWWDFEAYIHIYLRHNKFFKRSDVFIDKTNFQYETKMIKKVIQIVLQKLKSEMEEHFKSKPQNHFKRIGKRSPYFDGVYYVVEIAPSGRLVWFHPRN